MSAVAKLIPAPKAASVAKLENGYTRISNELLEATARYPLTSRQFRVLHIIARLTYGYKRRTGHLSTLQIAEACHMDPRHARKVIADLIKLKVLFRDGGQKGEIGINNHIDEWSFATDLVANPSEGFATDLVANTATDLVANPATYLVANLPSPPYSIKEIFKDKDKERAVVLLMPGNGTETNGTPGTPYSALVDLYHAKLPMLRRVVRLTPARKQALDAAWNDALIGPDLAKWEEFFENLTGCPFLLGQERAKDGTYFEADFDWLIQEDHLVKIFEGFYDERIR